MKIAVLVKQVPGRESPVRLAAGGGIDESAVTFQTNESDACAVEAALAIKDAAPETEVLAVTLGPARAEKVLRDSLAMGADRALHLVEEPPCETDPYANAATLAAALKEEGIDLLLGGLQSDDWGSGQTTLLAGELLGMATATLVVELELGGDGLRLRQELEGGWFRWIELPLPAALAIQTGINRPRYPTLKGIMGAKRKPVAQRPRAEVWSGTPLQRVRRLVPPPRAKRTRMLEGSADEQVAQLLELLRNEMKVL
ncbi:MAG: electron transfer flavoprotein beta subunit/FixA family protein [Nitrospirae bacterium]|nr:MAG: electron transfer flavoprotein beta subunit/FixA family protein [Nitrospirota bacterium]